MKKIQIGVMGPALCEYPEDNEIKESITETAEKIGELLAQNNVTVFTGGCDGVMEYALKGAKKANGLTVGVPGRERGVSNQYADVEIITDVDVGSFLFSGILSCDAIIFIPGGAGTLAELCIAYRNKKPCIIIEGFDEWYNNLIGKYLDNGRIIKMFGAKTSEEAVEKAIDLAKQNLK